MGHKSSIFGGVSLIVVGVVLFIAQLVGFDLADLWPVIIVAVGVVFLLGALLGRNAPLVVPGALVGGLGLILLYQNLTGDWESWSYVWTLIPGLVGLGLLLLDRLEGRRAAARRSGGRLLIISLVLFAIFFTFLGGTGSGGLLWPLLLIAAGAVLLVRNWRRRA